MSVMKVAHTQCNVFTNLYKPLTGDVKLLLMEMIKKRAPFDIFSYHVSFSFFYTNSHIENYVRMSKRANDFNLFQKISNFLGA